MYRVIITITVTIEGVMIALGHRDDDEELFVCVRVD